MKKTTLLKSAGIVSLLLMLTACQGDDTESTGDASEAETQHTEETDTEDNHDHDHEEDHDHNAEGDGSASEVTIDGLSGHYHTGDTVSLTAEIDDDQGEDHWHWYTRGGDAGEWESVDGADGASFETDAVDGLQVKAVLYDGDHEIVGESKGHTIEVDDHDGDIYNGIFEDEDVKDRDISDWSGNWQSVYPYFESGDLDEVYEYRAEESDDMTFDEYKDYYETGYETAVDNIDITDDGEFTFHDDGDSYSGMYQYDGYEILEYDAGNRGVRFIFELEDGDERAPHFIQFSDHNIAPKTSGHFHLYWGDDRDALLDEVEHWPTYYPAAYSTEQIIDDLLMH